MKLATPLEQPHRTRTLRTPQSPPVTERGLWHALLVALAVVIALCIARALTDRLHGQPSGEGTVARVLIMCLTAWFSAEALVGPHADSPGCVDGREARVDEDRTKRRTSFRIR
jgi:hypothetical protein